MVELPLASSSCLLFCRRAHVTLKQLPHTSTPFSMLSMEFRVFQASKTEIPRGGRSNRSLSSIFTLICLSHKTFISQACLLSQ